MPAYKDSAGKWEVYFLYTDHNGKRKRKHRRGFDTKREALEYEREFLNADRFDGEMLFAAAAKIFLQDKKNRVKPTTWRQYENTLKTVILPLWADIPVAEIDSRKVIQLQNKLLSKGVNPSTVGKYESTAKTIYKYIAKMCGLKSDPWAAVDNVGRQPRKSLQFWTLEEYNGFRDSIKLDARLLATFDTLFFTGLRIGELKALRLCDIDFPGQIIHVTKTYNKYHNIEEIGAPKTDHSFRDVSAPRFVLDEIKEFQRLLYGSSEKTRIFSFASSQYLRDVVSRYCEKTGVKYIKIHSFRHSHVALLINQGVDILTISERLGHTSPRITLDKYGHLYPDKQKQVAAMLDSLPGLSDPVNN